MKEHSEPSKEETKLQSEKTVKPSLNYCFCWFDTGVRVRHDGSRVIYHITPDGEPAENILCGAKSTNLAYCGEPFDVKHFDANVSNGFVCKRCERIFRGILSQKWKI